MTQDERKLKVFECFESIQGESTFAGRLCYFIRLAGCNLRCSYCDTQKALSFDSYTETLTPEELAQRAINSGLNLVEITGGEPLTQYANVCVLCERLVAASSNITILIETNGSIDASNLPPEVIRIFDWKTPSSEEETRMNLNNYRCLRKCDQVKFVISNRTDYDFMLKKVKEFDLFRKTENILLSPACGSMDGAELISWMLEDKFPGRLNVQLHKCFKNVQ